MMNFKLEVIDKSFEKPVLVDFWAPWCGPCKTLGPILDELAEEQKTDWTLIKVNTENEQSISEEYNIKSIPNVKLFHKGIVIGEFMGALPKSQVQKWLTENLPTQFDDDIDSIMSNNQILLSEKARQLEAVLDVYPDQDRLKIAVAMHSMFCKPQRAADLIADFKLSHPSSVTIQMIKDISHFMIHETPDQSPFDDTYRMAKQALNEEDWAEGVKKLIDLVSIDKSYENDLPRKTTIGVFQFLGPQHPVTKKYRKMFDMILW